jgi:hypothetical protein
VFGCAIPPKVAISARASCFRHSETSHARTVGSPMCSRQSMILASMRSLALHKPKRDRFQRFHTSHEGKRNVSAPHCGTEPASGLVRQQRGH